MVICALVIDNQSWIVTVKVKCEERKKCQA